MMNINVLIIIPARGGSKGIPQKNLRNLGGKPLISYAIRTALASRFNPDVYVSSDNDEILATARRYGSKTLLRSTELAKDNTTLDPVIFDAYQRIAASEGKSYDLILTFQPTSPLLRTATLDSAVEKILQEQADTLFSVVNDTHLTWSLINEQFVPNFKERLNRQQLTPVFRETGGIFMCTSGVIAANTRIGQKVTYIELSGGEAIDIDTYQDWNLCEYFLRRKKILFVITGNTTVGLGHVYNCLSIASNILNHDVEFVVGEESALALQKIREYNYPVSIQDKEILLCIDERKPDVVINDRLDTPIEYVTGLKTKGYLVINFEDLGPGATAADLVINAMYPERELRSPNHYFGPKYFCIKDEFQQAKPVSIDKNVKTVLITFGGVDPNNFTLKVLKEIYPFCLDRGIRIVVVLGMGYQFHNSIREFDKAEVHQNIQSMSEYMSQADIACTSAGRTTFEVASLGLPTIVMGQNEREMTHFFATEEFGFVNLGLGYELKEGAILTAFLELVDSWELRKTLGNRLRDNDIANGKRRVVKLINDAIAKYYELY
jgi:CMP-N-acetylneuraminic acid synthetase